MRLVFTEEVVYVVATALMMSAMGLICALIFRLLAMPGVVRLLLL